MHSIAKPRIADGRCCVHRRRWLLALAGGAVGGLSPAGVGALEAGHAAPAIELPGLQAPVSLAALKGKVVYLDFWASWCGPCRKAFPWLNAMQAKYGARGLQVLGVNLDVKRADADRFLAEVPARFTIAFDSKGETAAAYGLLGMPSSFVIGADGKVLHAHTGFRDEQRAAREAAIVAALPATR